jgi:hypothetical protein
VCASVPCPKRQQTSMSATKTKGRLRRIARRNLRQSVAARVRGPRPQCQQHRSSRLADAGSLYFMRRGSRVVAVLIALDPGCPLCPCRSGEAPGPDSLLARASPGRHDPQALTALPVSRSTQAASSNRSSEHALPWCVKCRPPASVRLTVRREERWSTKYEELTCGKVFSTNPPESSASHASTQRRH